MTIDLGLAQRQVELQHQVRELVTQHCPRTYARELDESGSFPVELWAETAFRDLLGLAVPTADGGTGGGLLDLVIVCEELARGAAALAVAYAMSAVAGGWALARFGTHAHHKSLLRQFVLGQARFALALAELETDDPIATAESSADDGYCIRAEKLMIPGAHVADQILVVARSDSARSGTDGLALFYVSPQEPGITVTTIRQMGERALPMCEVDLDSVHAAPETLLGELNHGCDVIPELAAIARLLLAAVSTGLAQIAFDDALAHAREPRQGRRLGNRQAVQHALAGVHTRIEAARLLVYHAAWCVDAGQGYSPHAALANYFASEAVSRAVETGTRIFVTSANRLDCDMQRYFRDAMPLVAASNPEMAKDLIARSLGL